MIIYEPADALKHIKHILTINVTSNMFDQPAAKEILILIK